MKGRSPSIYLCTNIILYMASRHKSAVFNVCIFSPGRLSCDGNRRDPSNVLSLHRASCLSSPSTRRPIPKPSGSQVSAVWDKCFLCQLPVPTILRSALNPRQGTGQERVETKVSLLPDMNVSASNPGAWSPQILAVISQRVVHAMKFDWVTEHVRSD